jgi:molybdate-binding protein/DNA-binding XRE family transcriptional regulator
LPKTTIETRLAEIRKSRGLGASELAGRAGVSRQTIHAIEAGTYVPNTELALILARELEVPVEDLFSLPAAAPGAAGSVTAEILGPPPAESGRPVRICRVGPRWVAVPVPQTPYFMPVADGVVKRPDRAAGRADLLVLAREEASRNRLLLAGCDPAASLLSNIVERMSGVEVVPAAASSKLALHWLKEGKVHIAGSHLQDPATGEFNLPYVSEAFAGEEILVVTFARWEEGLVVAPGNPKGLRKVEDLARRGVRFVNREAGAASRALLDRLLAEAGVPPAKVAGYDRVANGHLPAAFRVASGDAGACLATRAAAQAFGLDFVPLHSARYDLVMRKRTSESPAAKAFLDVLQRAALRRKLEVLAGYDTSGTGVRLR